MEDSKILLNVEETAAYLNIGKTKTREIMKDNEKIRVIIAYLSIRQQHQSILPSGISSTIHTVVLPCNSIFSVNNP